ncbi:MAG: LysR family transcriptional regulator [Ruminococcaceae bacterium]|nr:LysR family transcriptional regulator [Oscillospiraceae bacterium]
MLLKELRYVLAVHEHNSFTKAANSLFISQPALSKYIKGLENDMGIKLFEKRGNRFRLTYAGQTYLDAAHAMMNIFDKMEQDLLTNNPSRTLLKIGTTTFRGSYIFPKILPKYLELHPESEIMLFEEPAERLEKLLVEGTIDLIIVKLPLAMPNIAYVPLFEEHILLALPKTHIHANKSVKKSGCKYPWIDMKYFHDDLFVLLKPGQRTRQISDNLLEKANIVPKRVISTNNIETAVRLASTIGVSFIPELFAIGNFDSSPPLFFCIGEPITTSTFVLAYRRNGYLTRYAKDFHNLVVEYFQSTIDE